jgi:hypothetical protein
MTTSRSARTSIAVAVSSAAALVALSAAAGAPTVKPFAPHQEPRGIGNLIAPGDRVSLVYDAPGFNRTTGTAYVRNDRQRRFTALTLTHRSRPSSAIEVRVPARLFRGRTLSYYAVIRDPKSNRSVRVPARGTTSAWILRRSIRIRLGANGPHSSGTVVARAAADQVGWQIPPEGCGCGPSFGPQTFLVRRDGSVWLHDGLNNRLLGWNAGQPHQVVRTVPLPDRSADSDVALGPNGSFYITGAEGRGAGVYVVLKRLSSTGRVLWKGRLTGSPNEFRTFNLSANSSLRTGPDGTTYLLVGMMGLPGGEQGWMPVATPGGQALTRAAQRSGTSWPGQPLAGGRQLVQEAYTAKTDGPVTEMRYALVGRSGTILRSWRISLPGDFGAGYTTSELVGGDPVVVLEDVVGGKLEHVVLRLGPHGVRSQLRLPFAVFGDNLLADVRIGPDGRLYQLASSPATGVTISRYALR